MKIRAKGAALAAAADFLGNFLIVEVTPVGLQTIGWRFYIVFAVLNIVNAIMVWMFYPETAGIPLEKIDLLFTDAVGPDNRQEGSAFYRRLQWSVVGKASRVVEQQKLSMRALADCNVEEAAVGEVGSDSGKGSVECVEKR